jgi:hypothetical protein
LNPDLLKIRNSRFFRDLPDRAFEKAQKYIKIRSHLKAEDVLVFQENNPWKKYFGYVIEGKVLFLSKGEKPVGLAVKDEFFLGRSFKIGEHLVEKLVAASPHALVVYIPKEIVEILSSNSERFSEMIEEIYDSIFERSELMASDMQGVKQYREWLQAADQQESLSNWLAQLEKKRDALQKKTEKERRAKRQLAALWALAFGCTLILAVESFARLGIFSWAPSLWFVDELGEFNPGSDFNVAIGIVGIVLLVLSNIHTVTKIGIRKWKWKVNYQASVRVHMFMGLVGAIFVLFHTAGYMKGVNVAHLGVYAMLATIISGLIGQLISSQIPRSIQGEKKKISSIKQEMEKLQQKASLLMEDDVFSRSPGGDSANVSLWKAVLFSPTLWFQQRKIRRELSRLGLGKASAELGSQLLLEKAQLDQKVKSLEVANIFFKRWMWIHQPLAYVLYFFAFFHIIVVTLLV